jgi:molybdate transport system permease protein
LNSRDDQPRRRSSNDLEWRIGMGAAAALLLSFMLLPLVALVATTSWGEFWAGIKNPLVIPALKLSITTTLTSLSIVVVLGTPLAWIISRRSGRGVRMVETFLRLPVVLPPAVAGVALLLAFGRMGLLGSWLTSMGWQITYTRWAVIFAEVFVSAPFFLQAAIAAFRNIDESLLAVSRSLGASRSRTFFRVALPLAAPALIAGAAMSWARALGEFGATLMFAGNLSGKTQTLTLAIYQTFESDLEAAQAISLMLVVVAFSLLYFLSSRSDARMEQRRG